MRLTTWSGSVVDTADYSWRVWPRWVAGWVRYACRREDWELAKARRLTARANRLLDRAAALIETVRRRM